MKRLMFVLLTAICSHGMAQVEGGTVGEVIVKGSRTVQKTDALWIFPTETELKHSANAYSLLGKLALDGIRVDPSAHTLTAADNRGSVEVRINDVPATVHDMLSIDMASVVRVEYTNRPGLRYGQDVAYVVNLVVKRPVSGYSLGTDLTHDLTRRGLSDALFARFNAGKSEWGADYSIDYADRRGSTTSQTADYTLADGSLRTITRRDIGGRQRSASQSARLSYSLADSCYVFQARLGYSGDMAPGIYSQERQVSYPAPYVARRSEESRYHRPAFDLYFHRDFRRHQRLTASATATHILTRSAGSYDEGAPYSYHVDGRVWSLKSEALYENRLKPFVWTAGLQYNQKFTGNRYTGDAASNSLFRSSEQYIFSQLAGSSRWLQYTAGVGLSRRYYRQGESSHDFLVARPKLSIGCPLAKGLRLGYDYQRSLHTSQIAQTNDVALRLNPMEMLVGNPALKPNAVTEHTLSLSYQQPRLNSSLTGYAKLNSKPNMHRYSRTPENIFIDTQENQHYINLLMAQAYLRYELVPDKLNASLAGQLFHIDNKGWDYRHRYNSFMGIASLNAYLGRWTLMAYASTGYQWMEGETRGKNGAEIQLVASYQAGPLSLSLYCRNPFSAHPLVNEAELMNVNLHKLTAVRDSDQGNYLGLNFAYRLSRGRKYQGVSRTITLEDRDAGILK